MNEQVEQKANELLLNMIDKAQQGMEFAEAQIPDVVEQLLVWNFTASMIGFVFLSLLSVASAMMFKHAFTLRSLALDAHKNGEEWTRWHPNSDITSFQFDFMTVGVFFVSGAACAISIICALCQFEWLKIWLAPKVYLLEYAASLAK